VAIAPESPPGFVVRTEAQKAAWDNGYRLERDIDNGWLHYASTTARGEIWIAGVSDVGPWLLSIDHPGVVAEICALPVSSVLGPGQTTFMLTNLTELHAALDRIYRLAISLPEAPLDRFRARTAGLPRTTEAERIVIQRIGQDLFRDALINYWSGRCPMTGITERALLRASHIKPWADCTDAERLDVHNGLLLSALWDAAFDRGLVSFAEDGFVLASPGLGEKERDALGLAKAIPLQGLRAGHRVNLALHRGLHGF
jgi:HNH endonuclease